MTPFDSSTDDTSADVADLTRSLAAAGQASAMLGKALTAAFDQIIVKGKSAGDVFGSLAMSLSEMALKAAFQPLQQSFATVFAGMFRGGGTPSPFAMGGALSGGTPIPFAQGGIIASPVSFPLGAGRTGLAGERGAEAILPLARGADGRLGVASSGQAPGNITVNISASDVESFRRSETQIVALLTRAVAHGHRNL